MACRTCQQYGAISCEFHRDVRASPSGLVAFARAAVNSGLVPDRCVPLDLRARPTFIKAFKRGYIMAIYASVDQLPHWYSGEETRHAYRRGWNVGRELRRREMA